MPFQRKPHPRASQDFSSLDNVLSPIDTHSDMPVTALFGRKTIDLNGKPKVTKAIPDEPPADFDPSYEATDAHRKGLTLKAASRRRIQERENNQRYYNAMIEAMGEDRDEFVRALSFSDSPKIREFILSLCNHRFKGWSTTRIAAKHGIKAAELSSIFKEYYLAKAMTIATRAMPVAMERIVQDATSGQIVCQHCDGRTTVKIEIQRLSREVDLDAMPKYEVIVCPQCKGEGMVWKPGHEHSRDKMMQVVGWGPKSAGTSIHINQNLQFGGVESVIEEVEQEKAARAIAQPTPLLDQIADRS